MLLAEGDKCCRADAWSGPGPISFPVGRFAEQSFLKPKPNDSVAYPEQLGDAMKGIALGDTHLPAYAEI
jgi:hypothetical protein